MVKVHKRKCELLVCDLDVVLNVAGFCLFAGASKRVGTKQKSKILKKVREHHRKSKRQAKKDPTWKSKKKVDPGIPNSYPYKEQLLLEIEQKRIAVCDFVEQVNVRAMADSPSSLRLTG
jgi:predicted protein tyrosine phosphatase